MLRLTRAVPLLALGLVFAARGWAQEARKPEMQKSQAQTVELTGYIVDPSCKFVHNLSGPDHRECAQVCADKGISLGILTDDGTFYLPVSSGMPGTGANELLRPHAEHRVKVKGKVIKRAGFNGIVIESISM